MNPFIRLYHRLRSRAFERRASMLRRDLADYILSEQARILVLSHRAAWHAAQASPPSPKPITATIEGNGHSCNSDRDEQTSKRQGLRANSLTSLFPLPTRHSAS